MKIIKFSLINIFSNKIIDIQVILSIDINQFIICLLSLLISDSKCFNWMVLATNIFSRNKLLSKVLIVFFCVINIIGNSLGNILPYTHSSATDINLCNCLSKNLLYNIRALLQFLQPSVRIWLQYKLYFGFLQNIAAFILNFFQNLFFKW